MAIVFTDKKETEVDPSLWHLVTIDTIIALWVELSNAEQPGQVWAKQGPPDKWTMLYFDNSSSNPFGHMAKWRRCL